MLRFAVDRSGRVLDYAVITSSGYPDLDQSVEEMMRGATLPPFPAEMPQPRMEVSVTIRFSLRALSKARASLLKVALDQSRPASRKARSQRDHLPGTGRPGLRSLRQQTSAPGGASMNFVALLGIVNSSVET